MQHSPVVQRSTRPPTPASTTTPTPSHQHRRRAPAAELERAGATTGGSSDLRDDKYQRLVLKLGQVEEQNGALRQENEVGGCGFGC
jgi:hypothetical protein